MSEVKSMGEVTTKICTVPNLISILRLCLVPVFLTLLLEGRNVEATVLFALAAGTDWIDGQIARHFNQVSKLGQLLDPFVDRALMISGVVGLYLVDRLPLWIILLVIARDLFVLIGGGYVLKRYEKRIPVLFTGKIGTALLFVGFAALLLNWPEFIGLGLIDASFLPGLNSEIYSWGIWFIYLGLLFSLITTIRYVLVALSYVREVKQQSV